MRSAALLSQTFNRPWLPHAMAASGKARPRPPQLLPAHGQPAPHQKGPAKQAR